MPSTTPVPFLRSLLVVLAATILPATGTLAQTTDSAAAYPARPDSVVIESRPDPLRPWSDEAARFIGTALAAGAGSLGGLYGGALIGWNSGSGENIGALYLGMTVGTVLGAGGGSALVSGNTLRSLGGSLGGAVAGFVLVRGMSGRNGELQLATYTIVHALVTALIATS